MGALSSISFKVHCSKCGTEVDESNSEMCPNCGEPLKSGLTSQEVIDRASLDSIRTVVLDPSSQDALAANLTSSQVREIVERLPKTVTSDPRIKNTIPWIKVLRLDGKLLLKWSRHSEELRSVFQEVTESAFQTMPEEEIRSLLRSLPAEAKDEMGRLLRK